MGILAGSGSPSISVSGGLTPVSSPTIYNLTLTTAATEYSQVIPSGTKRIEVSNRNNQLLRLAFVSGGTSVAWLTISPGASYSEVDLAVTSLTVYLQAPSASGSVAEIIAWS
jgi:hypothetical protein